jgi:hypothetical protein
MSDKTEQLTKLRIAVEAEIDQYVYDVPEGTAGLPWSVDKVRIELAEMRGALVDPYWTEVEIRDTFSQVKEEQGKLLRCAVVAEDRRGYLLLWEPVRRDFFLAQAREGVPCTFGIRGDAVGCFLSR